MGKHVKLAAAILLVAAITCSYLLWPITFSSDLNNQSQVVQSHPKKQKTSENKNHYDWLTRANHNLNNQSQAVQSHPKKQKTSENKNHYDWLTRANHNLNNQSQAVQSHPKKQETSENKNHYDWLTRANHNLNNQSQAVQSHHKKQATSENKNHYDWLTTDPKLFFSYENASDVQFSLNVTAGQLISLDRDIPDFRNNACLSQIYPENLPRASIVIPFYNELWSVLLRCIHSIYNRTPHGLFQEIILIDDASTLPNLLSPLQEYIQHDPKIKLLRNVQREGLIRSRMRGAHHAQGEVLIFLDSHTEVGYDWLPPLISTVTQNHTTLAVPDVLFINPDTFKVSENSWRMAGTFSWELDYEWMWKTHTFQPAIQPYSTATTIGCAMVVDRNMFFQLGAFDNDMMYWGGENLEISFRTWMCGGSLKIVPCSKVGHVFRSYLPYKVPGGSIKKNLQRVAEVWMDEYKKYYYSTKGEKVQFSQTEISSLLERRQLRNQLKCNSFRWYLDNIVGNVRVPPGDSMLFGQMKSLSNEVCVMQTPPSKHLHFDDCPYHSTRQLFSYNFDKQIVHLDTKLCVTLCTEGKHLVSLEPCKTSDITQIWTFTRIISDKMRSFLVGVEARRPVGSFRIMYMGMELCLSHVVYHGSHMAGVTECMFDSRQQYWVVTYQMSMKAHLKLQ